MGSVKWKFLLSGDGTDIFGNWKKCWLNSNVCLLQTKIETSTNGRVEEDKRDSFVRLCDTEETSYCFVGSEHQHMALHKLFIHTRAPTGRYLICSQNYKRPLPTYLPREKIRGRTIDIFYKRNLVKLLNLLTVYFFLLLILKKNKCCFTTNVLVVYITLIHLMKIK